MNAFPVFPAVTAYYEPGGDRHPVPGALHADAWVLATGTVPQVVATVTATAVTYELPPNAAPPPALAAAAAFYQLRLRSAATTTTTTEGAVTS